MFEQVNEQIQKSLKPMSELASVNAKALEQLASQQNALFTGLLNDGVNFSQSLTEKQDVNAMVEAQKAYLEGVQEKIVAAAKETYDVISDAQEKAGEVLKVAAEEVQANVASK
ncbi:MAG: phasin family protein [Cellvibrionaceae bacterium]|nr:phasin family protein [Cellvibrionaceae bacterium]